MKIGLDYHGCLDQAFIFWSVVTNALVSAGHEVHIITGARREKIEKELESYKIAYTHFFSITEHLLEKGVKYVDNLGDWTFDNKEWNRAKAEYCMLKSIDIHLDDTENYGKHFHTPFFFLKRLK